MQALTKKRPIKIELHLKGPASRKEEALRALRPLGFEPVENEALPWRDLFPEIRDKEPGVYLAGARHKEGLTQAALSELTGIPQRHISEMENNKRPIGKKNARTLAKALKIDYRTLL